MPAVSVSIAEAVLAMLEAATLSQAITPERSYADWELALVDGEDLRVDVVAVTTEQRSELVARGALRLVVPVDIAVRKKFPLADQEEATGRLKVDEIDALCLLVEDIHRLFTPERLTDFQAGVWVETRILVNPIHKHLRELRQFTGIVRITFNAHD